MEAGQELVSSVGEGPGKAAAVLLGVLALGLHSIGMIGKLWADAIEEIVEPYLIQQGFIQRTPRGRMLTAQAFQHMGYTVPQGFVGQQASLFEEPEIDE